MTFDQAMQQGLTLHRDGKLNEAEQVYRQILQQARHAAPLHLLGVILLQKGQAAEARQLMEQSIEMEPRDYAAHNNLAEACKALGDPTSALSHSAQALALNVNFGPAHTTMADLLINQGRLTEASDHAQRAVTLIPDDPSAHVVRARYLLLTGQLTRAWPEYEWRLRKFPQLQRQLPFPRWSGGKIQGRSILLTAEQGYSDMIQFARFATVLAERDAEVYIECHPELKRLLARVPGVVAAFAQGETLPRCDFFIPTPSLPLAMNTSIKTIPNNVPYVTAHPKLIEAWRELIKPEPGRLKVGLAWFASLGRAPDLHRSIPLAALAALAEVDQVQFFSLQQPSDPAAAGRLKLEDRSARIRDFADMSAMIAGLDLVITADTAAAHLAGAMGKPVWVLLPSIPDWRWMLEREDSPWYPTARLFRQQVGGDWSGVIASVRGALQEHAGSARAS